MDVYCKRCGEPVELYHIQHDAAPDERRRFWDGEGCVACFGREVKKWPFRAQVMAALHDVLGDDLDGLAAELEDAEYLMGRAFFDGEES